MIFFDLRKWVILAGMARFRKDLTDKKFGRWTVLSYSYTDAGHVYWKCKCDCGTEGTIMGTSLTRTKNFSASCGCLRNENVRAARLKRAGKRSGKKK